jgi:predicted metalloendopeptidase
VDTTITPGDDFFAYANGDWLKTATISAGSARWGARDEISELTRARIRTLIDDARLAPHGSLARKVAEFRAAYLNEAAIERKGLGSLSSQLEDIARTHDKRALTRLLGSAMPADVDPFGFGIYESAHLLGLSVERSIHGENTYDVFLMQGGLGLGDRARYLSTDSLAVALRARYREHVGRMLALAGFDRASQRAESLLALETALARTHATREASANDHNADTRWSRADFARLAPGMDWAAFFAAAGLAGQDELVVWQPTAVTGVAALVASQSLETWKDYARFHLITRFADVLPRAFADEAATMRGMEASGQADATPRAQRALDVTQSMMSDAIGRMYVERYFPAAQKARVQAIVANVVDAFAKRAGAVTWMSSASKVIALAKLRTLYVGIGYPERWRDYSGLVVDSTDPLNNLRRVADWNYRHAIARIGQPVDMREWWIAPQQVGAVLMFQQNSYDFSAALLQPPKFDPAASDAATYGAIGAIIGHDVSHFIDVLGADYDSSFALRHWWTAEDSSRFQAVAEPLVTQFSGYRPFPDLGVDGRLTMTENVADLAGLQAAFDAYRHSLRDRVTDREYVRRHDREFFIAFAQSWRTKISDAALRTQLASNDHAPEMFRVATVRNLDAWYDAFDVRPGQRLYVEPKARVRIW